jgi:hypothetical protein
VTNAPQASAVASQMRKRNTATERNRARDAINPERCRGQRLQHRFVKKVTRVTPFTPVSINLIYWQSGDWRRRRWRERLDDAYLLALSPDNGVQFASEQ